MSSAFERAVPVRAGRRERVMKNRFDSPRRDEAPKKGRKTARKCPCCDAAPCSCEETCLCQELKGGLEDDEDDAADGPSFDDDFSFAARYGDQGA
jgi:hypothetical protein